jgi:hypothetical protein
MNIIDDPEGHETMLRPTKRWVIVIGVIVSLALVALSIWVWLRA